MRTENINKFADLFLSQTKDNEITKNEILFEKGLREGRAYKFYINIYLHLFHFFYLLYWSCMVVP